MKKNFGENKIIFFKHKLVNQFIDNEKIEYTPNFRISGNINDRIEKIYNIAKKYIDFIDSPRIVIGDKSCMSPFEFHFSMPYYSYMGDCIEDAINKKQIDFAYMEKRLEVCEKEIHRSYNRIFCNQILNRIKGKLDKNIVLLAKTRQFAEMLRERYNKDIYEFIDYNEYSNMEEIKIKIKNLNKDKNLLFILPEYFKDIHQEGLCTIFSDLGYSVGYDVILTLIQKQLLTSYIGKYEDVYGNSFDLQSKHNISIEGFSNKLKLGTNIFPCRISLKHGGYFEMGNNGRAQNSLFRLYIDSYLKIGDNCNFGIECDIACHSYSKIIIGNYVLMSVHEMIYSNDGHSIFQKEGNSYKCINVTRKPIIIGSHVWIGYRCNILSGTQIGDGSIVGAGSIVNKKFPNNVIIGGIPARIIKKNISWSGDPNIRDLKLDKITFDNYANDTKEE